MVSVEGIDRVTRTSAVFDRRESDVRSYCRSFDVVLDTGRGSVLRGLDGREYVDFLAGAGALNYGHNDPDMADALVGYIRGGGIAHDGSFVRDVGRRSVLVRERLDRIAAAVPGARVKGRGMMQGVDVGSGDLAAAICRRAAQDGLIVETSGADGEVVKILAPLTTPDELLRHGFDVIERSAAVCLDGLRA